jgi:hypothetical protein
MPNVQNNFSSTNGGNFADRSIQNVPASNPVDAVLSSTKNQNMTGVKPTGNFNSKSVNQ